jgi:hypothetical protein
MRDGRRFEVLVYGALGGVAGAGTMSVIRMAARRLGLIDKTVPQASEEWLADRAGIEPGSQPAHQAAQELMHLGYGMSWGLLYALLADRGPGSLWRGLAFGGLLWAVGMAGVLPLAGVTRPAWRTRPRESGVNIAAHLAYGVSTQLLTEELARQPGRRRTSDAERAAATTG